MDNLPRYNSFKEYIQENYSGIIENDLKDFLLEKFKEIDINGEKVTFDYVEVYELLVRGIVFKKSEIDKVEFECHFFSKYHMLCSSQMPPLLYDGKHNYFTCYFKGSFKNGFQLADNEIEIVDNEEFSEKLTSSLIPVISKDKYDAYASKFLKYFCPEALKTPTKLNIKKMLKDKGVSYYPAPLEPQVFGKTYFANDKASIFDENGELIELPITPGTILFDPSKANERGSGSFNNTIIHEAVHWFFHRNYFELRQLLDNTLTCAVCYKSEKDIEDEEIAWMEKQAKALAPRILMPKKMVLEKYKEISKQVDKEYDNCPFDDLPITWKTEEIVERIARFFGVSKASAKFRLIELGKTKADGVFNWNAETKRYYSSYTFKGNSLKDHQTFFVSKESMVNLLSKNSNIQEAMINHELIWVNGMLVANNPKYYDSSKNKLTSYALTHADECCLIIDVITDSTSISKEFRFTLCNGTSGHSVEAYVNDKQLAGILGLVDENAKHFEAHKKNIPHGFGDTVEYHCKKSDMTYDDIAFYCDISDKAIRNLRNESTNCKQITILKFGIGLTLSYPYINDLLVKGDRIFINTSNSEDNALLISILSTFSRIGFEKLYYALKGIGKEHILQLSKNFKDSLDKKQKK